MVVFKNITLKIKKRFLRLFKNPQKQEDILSSDYKPKDYWKQRHSKYGFNLRGVGNCSLSEDENAQVNQEAKEIFLQLCKRDAIDFNSASNALEVGCGTGLFTEALLQAGGKNLTAVDITDALLEGLREKFPKVSFKMLNIAKEQLSAQYDLIMMIDVTQHIVDDDEFAFAMNNIYSHLDEGGVFIVTAWLSEKQKKRTYYEVERPLDEYEKFFPNCIFSEPLPFRSKYIFTIKKA